MFWRRKKQDPRPEVQLEQDAAVVDSPVDPASRQSSVAGAVDGFPDAAAATAKREVVPQDAATGGTPSAQPAAVVGAAPGVFTSHLGEERAPNSPNNQDRPAERTVEALPAQVQETTGDAAVTGSTDVSEATEVTEDLVVDALREVFDPEIPVNIYELGLIYAVLLRASGTRPGGTDVDVKMTLTSPHCPVAETLPGDVARAVRTVSGVGEVDVEVVWDPTWNPDMMSEAAKLELGMF